MTQLQQVEDFLKTHPLSQQQQEAAKLTIKEMLKDPKIYTEYQQQKTEAKAKEWILYQSLITLMYSPSKRKEMIQKKIKEV